jgi:hypothetical protein
MSYSSGAARVDYSMGVEAEYSDNPTLAESNESDDLRQSALLGISLQENTSKVSADIRSLLEYRDYRDDSFPDESWFYLNGEATWTIRPSSFLWVVEDYYSQQEQNTLLPGTPDNLINTNVFSTGPDLYFHVNPVHQLHLGARGSDYRFENTPADNRRALLTLAWLYGYSSSTELSLNAQYQNAWFTETDDADFRRQDLFFRIDTEPSRSTLQIDLGRSYIDRETEEDVDGFLARLIWQNQFRLDSYFRLDASSQYTDSGLDLLTTGTQSTEFDRFGEQITGDIFHDQRLEGIYRFGNVRSSYDIEASYRKEDYEVLLRDRRSRGLRIVYERIYSSTVTLTGQLRYRKYLYLDVDQTDRERSASIGLNRRLTRNYTLRMEYTLNTQESNIPAAEYSENRILVVFFYGMDPGSYR